MSAGAETAPDRPGTIDDVARLAGVSRKSISRYLNNSPLLAHATRERIATVIAETGFIPSMQARGLALGRSNLIALIHDGTDATVIQMIATSLAQDLSSGDRALVVHQSPAAGSQGMEARESVHAFVSAHRPDGVILTPPLSQDDALVALCENAGLLCIPLGRSHRSPGSACTPSFSCDDRSAMAGLVAWLVGQGHQRIGLVAGSESSASAQQRELGYLDAMADHGLDRGPALIVAADNTLAAGVEAGHLLLQVSPRPTAVIACTDEMAAGVMHAAMASGISVPQDLSVAGFDDTPLAERLLPPLTSVHIPWAQMARAALQHILAGTQVHAGPAPDAAPAPPASATFRASLSVRQSVAARKSYADAPFPPDGFSALPQSG